MIDNKIYKYLIENKEIIQEAIKLDNSKWGTAFSIEELLQVGKEASGRTYTSDFKTNPRKTYIVLYNGDPTITLELSIIGARLGLNIIFMIYDDMLATNTLLVKLMQQTMERHGTKTFVKLYTNIEKEDIRKSTKLADKIIYIGDRFEYNNIRREYNIPVIYNGYGHVDVYTDVEVSGKYEEELKEIINYAFEHDIAVDFHSGNLEKELEYIDSDVAGDTCVIFSDDENKIKLLESKVNCKRIFINEDPFREYKFKFDIDELTTE